ncbi:MAG: hypothetical protein WC004_04030 [Candidatus Absconditabacterales bacterium]
MLKPNPGIGNKIISSDTNLQGLLSGSGYTFIPYCGEPLTKQDASYVFLGRCRTPAGTKLVIRKTSGSNNRFDIVKDDAFMGDPTWVIDLLGGKKLASFWGFEYIDDDILLLPGSEVVNSAIQLYNARIAQCIDDRIGVTFYTPAIDLVPINTYARDYIDDAKLPLASVNIDTQPNLREAMHDVSYHLSALLLPGRMHELVRKRLQIITHFLIDAQQQVLSDFAHHRTSLGDAKGGMSTLRQDVVKTMENGTALVTLAWHPAIPQELQLWSTKHHAVSSALGLVDSPLNSIYPKTHQEIRDCYRFIDTIFPGTIQEAIPFFTSFHDHLSRFDRDLCTLSLYQQMNLADNRACASLISKSIRTKITHIRSYFADKV